MLLIITSTGDRLFGFINIDDLDLALVTGFLDLSTSMTLNDLDPLKKGFLVNFSQFLDAAHISTLNCDEMAGDKPR